MKVIGITGLNAAGKGTFAEQLKKHGYEYYSLSDILREVLRKKNVEINRENLVKVGNEMREKHGAGALGLKLVEKFQNSDHDKFIVDSIRNPSEVDELRKIPGFTLVVIEADPNKRYERAMARGRNENASTFDEFITQENKEKSNNEKGQQLHKCIEKADTIINNDGSIEELEKKADDFLENF